MPPASGTRLLIARLIFLVGLAGTLGFALAAVYPGGSDLVWIVLCVVFALIAVGALIYMIVTFRAAVRQSPRRPEESGD
jgi:type VI protein secretion system component VasK